MHTLLPSVPPILQQATPDLHLRQRLLDTHSQVSCGVIVPFLGSWCTRFCCALQEYVSQSYVSCGSSIVGLMVTSCKRTSIIPTPEPLSLWQTTADLYLHRKHSDTVPSQSLWGPWVLMCTRFVWALWASLAGMGFGCKCDFAPPAILLGLFLCLWMWGISSKSL